MNGILSPTIWGWLTTLALVYPLVAIERTGDEPRFVFERGELTDHYIEKHHKRLLVVEPHQFMDMLVAMSHRLNAEDNEYIW